jgi:2-dehydropantoate 2-reductase
MGGATMTAKQPFVPKTFAVIGAGPVGCIVSAFLAKGGHEVILCDVVPELLEPAKNRGIIIEGAENLTQTVSHTCTSIDALPKYKPDVIFVTVKANVLPLIASAIEGFHKKAFMWSAGKTASTPNWCWPTAWARNR